MLYVFVVRRRSAGKNPEGTERDASVLSQEGRARRLSAVKGAAAAQPYHAGGCIDQEIVMRALSPVLLVLISLALSACYQVAVPVVEAGVRVPGLADGGYRQDDGTLVDLRWDADAGGYRVGAGGIVRLAPAGANVYIADYQAERRIVMFARLGDAGQVIFLTLPEAAEKRLAADVGVGLRPGPIKILDGQADTVRRYFAVAAQAGDLRESARLAPMRWN